MCLETTSTNNKTLALISQGYKVLAEYKLVEQQQLKGIYAIPSYCSGLLWFGVIFIHSGLYAESVFRFSILLPDKFPEESVLPTVIFQKDIFHPHICPVSHSLDLTLLFKSWHKDQHHIWHILKYIQMIFADPEGSVCRAHTSGSTSLSMDDVNNTEAMYMLANNRVDYSQRAKASTAWSFQHIFDKSPISDPHYIVIERYRPEDHQVAMERLKSRSWYEQSSLSSPPSVCVSRIASAKQLSAQSQAQSQMQMQGRAQVQGQAEEEDQPADHGRNWQQFELAE